MDVEYLASLLGPERPEVRELVHLARTNPKLAGFALNGLLKLCRAEDIDPTAPDAFLPRPMPRSLQVDGARVQLGQTLRGEPLCIDRSEAARGILVTGQAGAGKTNLAYWLAEKLRELGTVWIIDTARHDYAGLAKFLDIRYIAKRDACVNPLEPPEGTPLEHWLGQFAAVFAYAFRLGIASQLFLYSMLRRTHATLAEQGRFPSLLDVSLTYEQHRPKGDAEAGYLQRTLEKLRPLTLSCPELTAYERGLDLSFFLARKVSVIWEASDVEEFRSLLTLFHAVFIFAYRVNHRV